MGDPDYLEINQGDGEIAYSHPIGKSLNVDITFDGYIRGIERIDGPVTVLDMIDVLKEVPFPTPPPKFTELNNNFIYVTTPQRVSKHISHKAQFAQYHKSLCGKPALTESASDRLLVGTKGYIPWVELPLCRGCTRGYLKLTT